MFSGGIKFSDDDDFSLDTENTRTNLSSIFGITPRQQEASSSHKSQNTSLKYVPPKPGGGDDCGQKQQQEHNSKTPSSEWSILIAKVVSAFKLVNQENVSQGKLGLTVLKNSDNLRKIILYRSKTNVLSTTTLNSDIKFYIKNSYLQFRDDLQNFWSVLFEQQNDLSAVTKLIKDRIVEDQEKQETITKVESPGDFISQNSELSTNKVKDLKETDILSRMAKMGHQLPQMVSSPASATTGITTNDQSDSSDTEMISNSSSKPLVPLRKPKSSPQLVTFAHSQQTISPLMNTINTVASYSSSTSLLPADSNLVNMFMSENRTQNAEVRMNLSKLETKIERVLDKIDLIQRHGNNQMNDGKQKEDLILELEEKLLEYKKENRKLRLQLDELEQSNKYREEEESKRSRSICEDDFNDFRNLLQSMQIRVEDFRTSDEVLKVIIRKLENEHLSLKSQLAKEKVRIEDYKNKIEKLKEENEQQIKVSKENQVLQSKIQELETTNNSLQKSNDMLNHEKSELTEKLEKMTSEIENLKKDKLDLLNKVETTKAESEKAVNSAVKGIMNNLYHVLADRFATKKSFSSEEILRVCATSIKQETNSAITKVESNRRK